MAYYNQPPQPGGYNGIPPNVVAWFQSVDRDRSGNITANELQQALTNNDWSHFSLTTCHKMVSMFDRDYSGTIDINEFNSLWNYIQSWRNTFSHYDQDRSGFISINELHAVFAQLGFHVSPQFVSNSAMYRYDINRCGQLNFESFISCCILLQSLTGQFQQRDTQRQGRCQLNYEDFMMMAVSNLK